MSANRALISETSSNKPVEERYPAKSTFNNLEQGVRAVETHYSIPFRGRPSHTDGGSYIPTHASNPMSPPRTSSAEVETFARDYSRPRLPSKDFPVRTQTPQTKLMSPQDDLRALPKSLSEARSTSPNVVAPHHGDEEQIGTIGNGMEHEPQITGEAQGLQYHHQRHVSNGSRKSLGEVTRQSQSSTTYGAYLNAPSSRPDSSYSDIGRIGRELSPNLSSNNQIRTPSSQGRRSPDTRPLSYVDLLSLPYSQQAPPNISFNHNHLQSAVGSNASLLSSKQTLEMYRANVKKTNDPAIQYSFAIFMLDAAQESVRTKGDTGDDGGISSIGQSLPAPSELISEARQILQRLADRSYPFAQYYLADGFASGVFNKGKEDNDKAFPLFIAASKHGHAEAGYRAALCYEFGWGTRKDPLKAVQFFKQSASKNHPGAMVRLGRACLTGDLGLGNQYKQGVKWLKRAAESADFQYNSAPYELGILHETGYGDDIFRDETYAAQLFTQSADLGHPEASFRLGDAYEHGKLNCPRDPALSVHFYNGAASRGHPQAMMALCAWYMVGAEPVLEKDESEAYEWAKRSAECGLPKAEYAVGYFTEMGIGCRRDPLEANVWYVKAADQGDDRAKHRIAAIQAAAAGGATAKTELSAKEKRGRGSLDDKDKSKSKKWGIF